MRALANAVVSVGLVFVIGLAVRGYFASHATGPPVAAGPSVVVKENPGRRVIATGEGSRSYRCDVRGFANSAPVIYEIDTGAPDMALFSSSYVDRLGIKATTLRYEDLLPGKRFGKIATTTLREIRIGDVVWNKPEVQIMENWRYSFGDDEIPLLGLPALKSKGVNVEFNGDSCRLTVARYAKPGDGFLIENAR